MNYAVIETGGKQYKVTQGDTIEIEKIALPKDSKVEFDKVLLLVEEGSVKIGKPYLSGVKVVGKLVEQLKGEKVRVAKFKSKVRYRRVFGFRPSISKVKIETIGNTVSKKIDSSSKEKVVKKVQKRKSK